MSFDKDGTERRLFVHLEELPLSEQIKDAVAKHIYDFTNSEIQSMCYWSVEDFQTWYNYLD